MSLALSSTRELLVTRRWPRRLVVFATPIGPAHFLLSFLSAPLQAAPPSRAPAKRCAGAGVGALWLVGCRCKQALVAAAAKLALRLPFSSASLATQ